MAVVVAAEDAGRFLALADGENLEATIVARVTESPRLVMHWNGRTIVDVSRAFLSSNGAEKHIDVLVEKPQSFDKTIPADFGGGPARSGAGSERLLAAGALRAVRLHHRRGHGAHAVRRT